MPKASVDKHDGLMADQHDVRPAGQIFAVETESESESVQH
jgi:hypothetical protein